MKSVFAVGMLVLALSLCNLMGRRSTNNNNRNASGTETNSAETSTANSAASQPPPPPAMKPTPVPTWVGVLNGKAIKLVMPPYPPIAKSAHASGEVRVQVVVDEEGNVILAAAESGHPLLHAAAVMAARQSKFTPTKLAGQPVKVRGEVVYNFVEP